MFAPWLDACDFACEIALSTAPTPDASPCLSCDTAVCTVSLTVRNGDRMTLHNVGLFCAAAAARRISRLMNNAARPALMNAVSRPCAPDLNAPARYGL